ncbi:MAG: hypothetical protein RLZZ391_1174 [Bacteroidota bacterium]|jgi:preprotein translocase subunit SecG
MITFFLILIVVACVALGFMVLIQNPKGGGLNANVGGLSNNFMGVKQTTDVLEKGTWIFASVIAVGNASSSNGVLDKVNTSTTTAPATQVAPPPAPVAADTNKK